MSLIYEVIGYDRRTGQLIEAHEVPQRRVPSVKRAAGVRPSDDGLGSYPLSPEQVAEIATIMETSIKLDDKAFFLEPHGEPQRAA